MGLRTKVINQEVIVDLKLKVNIESFSNHNGFNEGQVEMAIEEFKESINEMLKNKLCKNYQMEELQTVDFVNFSVKEL